jgi:heme/copper-type cytochrome/quinol oxidase subunit 1
MHFLGLAGMPRRIFDYPDSYAFLNSLSSFGSMLTVFSFLLFVLVMLQSFSDSFKMTISEEVEILRKKFNEFIESDKDK